MNWLKHAIAKTDEFVKTRTKSERKTYGQFFTAENTAKFMADLLDIPEKGPVSILDPGAGSGILSIALLERLEMIGFHEQIHLDCYETDSNIIPTLQENLEYVKSKCSFPFNYSILEKNYILTQSNDFEDTMLARPTSEQKKYDLEIINPPYLKLSKNAPESLAMSQICKGAPNLYFLFAAMGLFNLNKESELVIIIPRSWTSGLYFKSFRNYLFQNGSIEQIHLFISRNEVFDKESVLQETIILKVRKATQNSKIKITTSSSNKDFDDITEFTAQSHVVISGPPNKYVYLVTSTEDLEVLQQLEKFKKTLPDIGLKMKTGLTVDFRSREFLRNEKTDKSVPLYYCQHIKNGRIHHPIGKDGEWLETNKTGLLQENQNYLFVKRFTSKEEKRRFQCGVYLSDEYPMYSKISTQNKINFITGNEPLDKSSVYGLFVLFNSTLYDQYYRILNGSTQVNSTEVNNMPVPSLKTIKEMGKMIMKDEDLTVQNCDRILGKYL